MALVLFGCDTDNWSWKIVKRLVGAAGSIAEIIQRWKGSVEGQQVYTLNRRKTKKLIPVGIPLVQEFRRVVDRGFICSFSGQTESRGPPCEARQSDAGLFHRRWRRHIRLG